MVSIIVVASVVTTVVSIIVIFVAVLYIVVVYQKFLIHVFEAVGRRCFDNVVRDTVPDGWSDDLKSFFTIVVIISLIMELESLLDDSNIKMVSLLNLSTHSCSMIMNFMLKDKPVMENRWAIKVQG